MRRADSLSDDMNYAVDTYNTGLTAIIDKHAPIKTRTVDVRPDTPWYIRRHMIIKDESWNSNGGSLAWGLTYWFTAISAKLSQRLYTLQNWNNTGNKSPMHLVTRCNYLRLLRSCFTLITIHYFRRANHLTRWQCFSPTSSVKRSRQLYPDLLTTPSMSMASLGKRCHYGS